jgi:hypothetical protein
VALAANLCAFECGVGSQGECVQCYQDSIDHDGDGYSFADGDCRDCDPSINPGAYDFPANGVDEDCSGIPDDEPRTCDNDLALESSQGISYAQAMELCKTTTENATGSAKTWGVISAELVQANGTSVPDWRQTGVLPNFGSYTDTDPVTGLKYNAPRAGRRMAAFSTGTARDASQANFIDPSGQVSSYDAGSYATPPTGFPQATPGCPLGDAAYDSAGLKLRIRVPSNAQSFRFNFNYFTSEYPEWVCNEYNDSFVAIMQSSSHPVNVANAAGTHHGNLAFDGNQSPINVNAGFFGIPSSPTTTSPLLLGTGFDGFCDGYSCGGCTGWLQTSAPVLAGETVDLLFNIWDSGDPYWDSTVLMDNWRWSTKTAQIVTVFQPEQPPALFSDGSFVREYDASSICQEGENLQWGLWSWSAQTPGDSQIAFYVSTAKTQAELDSAVEIPLLFSDPPGPTGLNGQPAIAKTTPLDTTGGSTLVDSTFVSEQLERNLPFVRVRSHLMPSSSGEQAPILTSWNLQIHCVPSELPTRFPDRANCNYRRGWLGRRTPPFMPHHSRRALMVT